MLREILLMSKTLAGHISSPDNEDNEFGFPARELLVLKQSFIHIFQRSLRKPNEKKNETFFIRREDIYTKTRNSIRTHTSASSSSLKSCRAHILPSCRSYSKCVYVVHISHHHRHILMAQECEENIF